MNITISIGKSRKETRWKIKTIEWSRLVDKLRETVRTAETEATYRSASKERKAEIKDVGGFVGGAVEGGRRVKGRVRKRSLLTLDIDYASSDVWEDITMNYGCAMVLYSTHSHTPENPRYRLIIPLDREATPDEHEAVARRVAETIGIDQFDDSTYQAERLMYYPSTPRDGEYVFEEQEGEPLSVDETLAEYRDWRDVSQWAVSSRVDAVMRHEMRKKGEPCDKPGALGAFCRSYSISEAIDEFLSDIYEPVPNAEGRYTYLEGTSSAGLVVYEDKFAFSHHATDPCNGQLCNAFDLVRIHLYGSMDDNVPAGTPITKYPSYLEMENRARNDAKVIHDLSAVVGDRLMEDFGALFEQPEEEEDIAEDMSWMDGLTRDKKNNIESTSMNILTILSNAPGLKGNIRRNDFTHTDEVARDLPWRKVTLSADKEWGNDDDARLRVYLEKYYGIQGKEKILNCFTEITTANRYHPIRNYLNRLKWDGVERAETILIDYLGADDTPLTRSVTRKFLAAAVARIYEPGKKFDYVTVLQGKQGIGKSTLLARLAGSEWFNDSMTDLNGKDAMEMLQGSWIIELGELQAIKRSEVESIKSFLSRQIDSYRPAYGRVRESHPRQCIFFATTNEETFLKGADGNRRFWVVACNGNAPKDVFSFDNNLRDQIWAEAMTLYLEGEELFLEDSLETQMRVRQGEYNEDVNDVRLGIIEEYLNKKLPTDWNSLSLDQRTIYLADDIEIERRGTFVRDRVCAAEIMTECFHERINENNKYHAKECNNMMKKIAGWRRLGRPVRFPGYGVQRGFERIPEDEA